jgi:hypothetical protein
VALTGEARLAASVSIERFFGFLAVQHGELGVLRGNCRFYA